MPDILAPAPGIKGPNGGLQTVALFPSWTVVHAVRGWDNEGG